MVALLDDPSLKVAERGKKNSAPVQGGQTDYWPESHRAHSALCLYFSRFGLKGRTINLAEGHSNNVAEEIVRLKAWWKEHGQNFLAGRTVPSPDLTTVMSYR